MHKLVVAIIFGQALATTINSGNIFSLLNAFLLGLLTEKLATYVFNRRQVEKHDLNWRPY